MPRLWYCVECNPRSEPVVEAELLATAYETLLPQYLRSRPRRHQSPIAPLFPGYLFVRFDVSQDQWGEVRKTRGVRRVLAQPDGKPIPLPSRTASQLVEHFAAGPVPDLDDAVKPFRAGITLRLIEGPFIGFEGRCLRSDRARVFLLLSIFGRPTEVEAAYDGVEVAA